MILIVQIARVTDGMLLVASTDPMRSSDAQDTMDVYKGQARQIIQGLTASSPPKCSIESGPYSFHYVITDNCCYLALTHKAYPKRLIFQYLSEIASEFTAEVAADHGGDWRTAVETVGRPYAFIKFDRTLQKKRRDYADPRSASSQSRITSDIADIHNIMRKNIDEVLNRGERLDHLVDSTQQLKSEASKYKWGAKKFSLQVMWNQYAPFVALGGIVLFVVYLKFRF